ncbi:MAG: pyruvate kinase [Pseudomonadota bacterium]|jgi:pyruvate kinase
MKNPNRTKIVATLGPASSDEKMIAALIKAGVNVFRLNCSHQTHEELTNNTKLIRKLSRQFKEPIGILADLQGPKIRVGKLSESIEIPNGSKIIISTERGVIGKPVTKGTPRVGTGYEGLSRDVKAGEPILLDDGNLELKVEKVVGTEVHCEVVHGGLLKQYKGINLPGSAVSAEALTAKDRADLEHVLTLNVDFVALSFVRSADDVRLLTRRLEEAGSNAKVISKLERPEVVANLDEIIDASYGVMVARGDMGVELGPEAVPGLQKKIIAKCIRACKPVITATQMLESMISNPRPTRAEASDVANAIYDGTSAVMLSGETAAGKFPVRTVEIMASIIRKTESDLYSDWVYSPNWQGSQSSISVPRATVHAAARGALEADAKLLAVFTESGYTARYLAGERLPIPVVVFSPNEYTVSRLSLAFGVLPRLIKNKSTSHAMTVEGERVIQREGLASAGDRIVMVFGSSRSAGFTNIVNIRILGDSEAGNGVRPTDLGQGVPDPDESVVEAKPAAQTPASKKKVGKKKVALKVAPPAVAPSPGRAKKVSKKKKTRARK